MYVIIVTNIYDDDNETDIRRILQTFSHKNSNLKKKLVNLGNHLGDCFPAVNWQLESK